MDWQPDFTEGAFVAEGFTFSGGERMDVRLANRTLFVRFWSEHGEKQSADRNVFFSNLSIVGGCLLLAISGRGGIAFPT